MSLIITSTILCMIRPELGLLTLSRNKYCNSSREDVQTLVQEILYLPTSNFLDALKKKYKSLTFAEANEVYRGLKGNLYNRYADEFMKILILQGLNNISQVLNI